MTTGTQEVAGLSSRRRAASILTGVLHRKRSLDDELEAFAKETSDAVDAWSERDRALVRMLSATVLRRLGTLRGVLDRSMPRGMPDDSQVEVALLLGTAQILWLDVPDHAAVDLSVRLIDDRHSARFRGLVNAVLRRIGREAGALTASLDSLALDTPPWLRARWIEAYGSDTTQEIARAHAREAPLDLSVKTDPEGWAARLSGRVVFGETVRTLARGPVTKLPGYAEGAWWVQDAAAALPVTLFGDITGLRVADLCAAPGGKAAQLASGGARVTAVDRSAPRLQRLKANLERLRLTAELVTADVTEWTAEPFDAALLDPPCSSTGTIRRHPDIPWLKREADIPKLSALQARMLDRAADWVRPGGTLVYCTCSLEKEEGEDQITALLSRDPRWRRRPIGPAEVHGHSEFISSDGDLRTLPCYLTDPDSRLSGLDGFFAARLVRLET